MASRNSTREPCTSISFKRKYARSAFGDCFASPVKVLPTSHLVLDGMLRVKELW